MSRFIPVNNEEALLLEEELSKTLFRSVKDFVVFYNSGLINKRSPEVEAYSKKITETYKDVDNKNSSFVFLSESEVLLEESLTLLEPWIALTRLKRLTEEAIEEGTIDANTNLVFTPESVGFVFFENINENGENVLTRIGNVKQFQKQEFILEIFEKYSSTRERDGDIVSFKANDLLNLDDSFIKNVYNAIPKN